VGSRRVFKRRRTYPIRSTLLQITMVYDLPLERTSPISGNKFETREDVQRACMDLFSPLLKGFSPGGARVRVEESAAHFDQIAADLEGFARPLWGIVPYVYGGGKFDHWDLYRKGLANGTDPKHPEYWGDIIKERPDQRLVEMAALGVALAMVPEHIFDPLTEEAKTNVKNYLKTASEREHVPNNWRFFRVLVILGLKRIGGDFEQQLMDDYLRDIDSYYIENGWYGDGENKKAIDHYGGFALHFYGLIYSVIAEDQDPKRAQQYKERSKLYAKDFRHWFSEDGASLPFGRSLTYRFAQGSFWAGLALADVEALPWGEIKGLYLRHLRWWAQHRLSRLDSGLLPVGYVYPQPYMNETYNSAQSPYWAMKAFFALAVPPDHPFWTAKEVEPNQLGSSVDLEIPGMVICHQKSNTVALVSGPSHQAGLRKIPEKYCKFVYSTRYGFSVENTCTGMNQASVDGMIALSNDSGETFKVRTDNETCKIFDGGLYAEWYPWPDVKVETWLLKKDGNWHIRVHRINSQTKDLQTKEGGFAVSDMERDGKPEIKEHESGLTIRNITDYTSVVDLKGNRQTFVQKSQPNTNIMFPRCCIPQLDGTVQKGREIVFAAAFAAGIDKGSGQQPELPSINQLETLAKNARPVKCTERTKLAQNWV
jgi:hypothetical protein